MIVLSWLTRARWWLVLGVVLGLASAAGVQTVRLAWEQTALVQEQGEHKALKQSVETTNKAATKLLETRTAERDALQAKVDAFAEAQEKKDAETKLELDRLAGELRDSPIRVRIVPKACGAGGSGGSGASQETASTVAGAGDSGTGAGLLPEENSQRLKLAIAEVERMSAAYGSCRASLLGFGQ